MAKATGASGGVATTVQLLLYWAFVGIPLLWGVSQTIAKAAAMFH